METAMTTSRSISPSIQEEWASESILVAIARATSWQQIADQSTQDHNEMLVLLDNPGMASHSRLLLIIQLLHNRQTIQNAINEIRLVLQGLKTLKISPECQAQADVLATACNELDIERAKSDIHSLVE